MIKRQFYGWHDGKTGTFRLSMMPPDSPIRPSIELADKNELKDFLERKRGQVVWWPALPGALAVELAWTVNRFPTSPRLPKQPRIRWPGRSR